MANIKTSKQLERHFKGVANHRRLDILFLIYGNGGLTLEKIADALKCNFKTISGHTKTLVNSGLLDKKYRGRAVEHALSPYGEFFIDFIKKFQRISGH